MTAVPPQPPQAPRHAGRRQGHHVLVGLVTVVAVLAVAVVGGGWYVYHRLGSNITAHDILPQLGKDRPSAALPTSGSTPATNILVMGSDTRAGADSGYGADVKGARSDTVVLVHLSQGWDRADLVSIPRDSVVDIPTCFTPDGKTLSATRNRFNYAFSEGGAACTVRTVEQLTNIRIDHYVVIDFSGFKKMIDALGGVDICVPQAVNDPLSDLHLTAGRHSDVDGTTALAYARARYTLGDGSDIGRIQRQQALMSSMVQKVQSAGVLLRPDKLFRFLDAATSSVTTDPALKPLGELRKVAQSLKDLPADRIDFLTVPWKPDPENPKATIVWKEPAAGQLWEDLRFDRPVPGTPAAQHAATSPASPSPGTTQSSPDASAAATPADTAPLRTLPANIRVRVLNGSGVSGQAAKVAAQLRAAGFDVVAIGTAPAQTTTTLVRRSAVYDESGRTLSAALPGSTQEIDSALGRTLEVVVGSDFAGVSPIDGSRFASPTPGTDGQASPAATPTTTPLQSRSANQDICS